MSDKVETVKESAVVEAVFGFARSIGAVMASHQSAQAEAKK